MEGGTSVSAWGIIVMVLQILVPMALIISLPIGLALWMNYRKCLKAKEVADAEQWRLEQRAKAKGPRYRLVLERHGELEAELDDIAFMHRMTVANKATVQEQGVLIAVNDRVDHLLIVGRTKGGTITKMLRADEIVSVEKIVDVRQSSTSVGSVLPIGDLSVLMIGNINSSRVEGVWLKILVRDVTKPWLVLAMPDVVVAEQWLGIITLLINQPKPGTQASDPRPVAAEAVTQPEVDQPIVETKLHIGPKPKFDDVDDGLFPLPTQQRTALF